jgi:hypothetical protein
MKNCAQLAPIKSERVDVLNYDAATYDGGATDDLADKWVVTARK